MTIPRSEIEAFLESYANALGGRDPVAVAQKWATPALILSHEGQTIVAASRGEVEALFGAAVGQYQKISSTRPAIGKTVDISKDVAGCDVAWEHRDKAGKPIGEEKGFYILKREGGRLVVQFYAAKVG